MTPTWKRRNYKIATVDGPKTVAGWVYGRLALHSGGPRMWYIDHIASGARINSRFLDCALQEAKEIVERLEPIVPSQLERLAFGVTPKRSSYRGAEMKAFGRLLAELTWKFNPYVIPPREA